MVPTLGDHLVLLGTVEQLEDKLNRLFTFYKKVWLGSGINAYQYIDCRFNHQVVALKKGMQPIQFTGDFKLLAGDSTIMMQAPVFSADSSAKAAPALIEPAVPITKSEKVAPAKVTKSQVSNSQVVIPKSTKAITKKKVQVKTAKSKPKLNNKPKNNSLNKKNKTAKALMPKKSKSPTKNN
jgi:cell division protein FtsQ